MQWRMRCDTYKSSRVRPFDAQSPMKKPGRARRPGKICDVAPADPADDNCAGCESGLGGRMRTLLAVLAVLAALAVAAFAQEAITLPHAAVSHVQIAL